MSKYSEMLNLSPHRLATFHDPLGHSNSLSTRFCKRYANPNAIELQAHCATLASLFAQRGYLDRSTAISLLQGEDPNKRALADEQELVRQYAVSIRDNSAHPHYSIRYQTYRTYDAIKLDLIEQGIITSNGWEPKTLTELAKTAPHKRRTQ